MALDALPRSHQRLKRNLGHGATLEIAFHNMSPSASLEAEIRQRVEKLEKRYGRLIGCRVSVEALHRQHHTGNIYEVHITLSVPGQDFVLSGSRTGRRSDCQPRRAHLDARRLRSGRTELEAGRGENGRTPPSQAAPP